MRRATPGTKASSARAPGPGLGSGANSVNGRFITQERAMSGTTACKEDPAGVLCFVEQTQKDGRLLLRFVARRSDRTLSDHADAGGRAGPPGCDVLFEKPEVLAADGKRICDLLACVDALSHLAAPANVRSIRLTASYLGIALEGGEPPGGIRWEALRTKLFMYLVGALAVLLLLTGVALLAHMDAGRRLLQHLKDQRATEREVLALVSTLAPEETKPGLAHVRRSPGPNGGKDLVEVVLGVPAADDKTWQAAPLCVRPLFLAPDAARDVTVTFLPGMPAGAERSFQEVRWRDAATGKAADLCRRADDVRVRMALLYSNLAEWNCRSHRALSAMQVPYDLFYRLLRLGTVLPDRLEACDTPQVGLPAEISLGVWRSHETSVTITTAVVGGFLLPLLLGSLGGCAYAMRRIDQKLSSWTLEPQDGRHAVVRVGLAAVLGGLAGVMWTGGEPVAVAGLSLSVAAVAFFVGYSVEPVFRLIETVVIDGLIAKMSGQPAGPRGAPPARPAAPPAAPAPPPAPPPAPGG
jgi:hypothetical protein